MTIIHGDIGRKPSIVIYYMEKYFKNWTVLYRPFDDEENPHDVLIWFEPPFNCTVEQSNKCTIVFTSHLYLKHNENVIDYQLQNITFEPLLETFEQNDMLEDIVITPTLFRNTTFTEIDRPSTVYIDLSHCRDIHTLYLCFLNAIENLHYYADFVQKWKISNNAMHLLQFYYNFSKKWKVKKLNYNRFIKILLETF